MPELPPAPPRHFCTDCGLSRTDNPKRCGQACQFIQPDYPGLEQRVHGRVRQQGTSAHPARPDELFFGPYQQILSARLDPPTQGAQWTGITTRLAEVLLEQGLVDAVIAMAADPNDRWRPRPVLVTRAQDMAQCRGMRMGYAPLLSLVEPALAQGHKRLAVIGIPCQIYALRAIQPQLEREQGLEQLYVIGTPCSDNTTTENFHQFLGLISDRPQDISYVEFRADYKVEVRTDQGDQRLIPFLNLPLSTLPPDFFPLTCRTCVDYTNVLADITVGYMGGHGQQWLQVRTPQDLALRVSIIKRRDAFDKDPAAFKALWHKDNQKLQKRILKARELLDEVQVSDDMLMLCARLCQQLGTDGLRAELTLLRATRAYAALQGHKAVKAEHLQSMAPLALRHRLRRNPLDDTDSGARVQRSLQEVLAA
ncbi:MAG: Coenzyme F420 hydrogenase/dehydrogenase, beta subunit C-terminal domain [Limnohabitans sp.]|uniref:Coenzyme F420 hydrogenase/dehydrogenase, beta subunit C-terminal domain n=1 Tax=Limnohabitans sp. TaxID=1907725 RepID=UPI003C70E35B